MNILTVNIHWQTAAWYSVFCKIWPVLCVQQ